MLKNSLVVTFVVGALALGGCGSSSSGSASGGSGGATGGSGGSTATGGAGGSTGGSGGTTSTGGAGGSAGGAGGSAGGAGGSAGTGGSAGGAGGSAGGAGGTGGMPNLMGCGSSGTNTCTQAETDAQNQCLISKCESAYTPCIGTGWKTGDFGGSCGTWFKCVNACPCGNIGCFSGCGLPSAECTTCLMAANNCQMTMCPQPACYGMKADAGITLPGVDGGTGGAGCEDLAKCCATITNEAFKMACTQTVASGNAGLCSGTLAGYRAAMVCQ